MQINSKDPMFERFEHIWTFDPAAAGGTDVEYRVDFEVRSRILQALAETSFAERTKTIMTAYMRWAEHNYGSPMLSRQ